MPPTVLLLDIDGTLVDNTQQHIAAWDEAFQQLGKPLNRETLRRNIGKRGAKIRARSRSEWKTTDIITPSGREMALPTTASSWYRSSISK